MAFLVEQHRVAPPIYTPLRNHLVVAAQAGEPPLSDLSALTDVARIAIADPTHVPAGIYAQQGLLCAGLWQAVEPHIVPMLDVRAAMLAVRHGAADYAVVYASDVLSDPGIITVLAWPQACQPEIRYTLARLTDAPNPAGAHHLIRFLIDPAQADVWTRFGFISNAAPLLPDLP
jgi:molybdate transport system substrate-binding protein